MNLYAYVANDPVNRTDPSGMWSDHTVVTGEPWRCGGGCSIYTEGTFNLGTVDPNTITVTANKPKKPQSGQKASDPCQSLGQKIGNALENAGKGVSYSGLTIAGIGAFAGPEGAAPGLFMTEAGGVLSTLGQVSQDIAFSRPIGEIAGRALLTPSARVR